MANPNDVLNEAFPDNGTDPLSIGMGIPLIAPGERERQLENARVGQRLSGKAVTTATTRLAEARKKRDATAKKLHDLGMDPDEIRQGRASFSPIGMTADELQDAMKRGKLPEAVSSTLRPMGQTIGPGETRLRRVVASYKMSGLAEFVDWVVENNVPDEHMGGLANAILSDLKLAVSVLPKDRSQDRLLEHAKGIQVESYISPGGTACLRFKYPQHPFPELSREWRYACWQCEIFHPPTHKHARSVHKYAETMALLRVQEHEYAVEQSGGLYNDAVEAQLATQRYVAQTVRDGTYDGPDGWMKIIQKGGHPGRAGYSGNKTGEAMVEILRHASPYYWSRSMCDVVHPTVAGMPAYTLLPELLPTQDGFFYLARPFLLPEYHEQSSKPNTVNEICWSYRIAPDQRVPIGVLLVFFRPRGVGLSGEPIASVYWPFNLSSHDAARAMKVAAPTKNEPLGMMFDTQELDPAQITRLSACISLFAASLAFLNQQLMVSSRAKLRRETRKRVEAEQWQHVPLVRVVHLRKIVRVAKDSDETVAVEWSCRWMVRGFWRSQYYSSLGIHQPKWIAPFIKGPPGKPMKPPRATVFAVVR